LRIDDASRKLSIPPDKPRVQENPMWRLRSRRPLASGFMTTGMLAPLFVGLLPSALLAGLIGTSTTAAGAQDWGSDPEDDWSTPAQSAAVDPALGWSLRAGVGFTAGPETFLMNFELPYAFDRWVSAGPMVQVGLDNNETIVAPTLNVTLTIPDLPGSALDKFHPFVLVGMGFAVLSDDNRRNDNTSAGFLVPFGFGIEYAATSHFAVGSQMMVNFLPEETLDQNFWYSWQILGARFSF
jgi:hypothetical protein